MTFTSCKDYDDDITKLEGDLTTLKSELISKIDAAQSQLSDALTAEIASVTADLNATKADLAAAKDRVTAAESELAALAAAQGVTEAELAAAITKLNKAVADLAALQGKHDTDVQELRDAIADAKADLIALIGAVDGRVDGLVTDLAAAQTALATAQQDIIALATRIGVLETFKTDTEGEISAMKAQLTALETALGTKASKAELQAAVDDLTAEIERVEGKLDDLKAEAATKVELQAAVDALEDKIDGLETSLTQLINALEGRIADIENDYITQAKLTAQLAALKTTIYVDIDRIDDTLDALGLQVTGISNLLNNLKTAFDQHVIDVFARITQVETDLALRITTLETLLGLTDDGDSEVLDGIAQDLADQLAMILENKDDIATLRADLLTQRSELETMIGNLKTELKNAIDLVDGKVDALDARVEVNEGDIEALEGRMDTVEGKVNTLTTKVDNILDVVVPGLYDVINDMTNRVLRGLVLVPHYYVNGVAAVGYMPLEYDCGGDTKTVNPVVKVHYKMNPSTVTKEMIDWENLSFIYKEQTNKLKSGAGPIEAEAEFVKIENGELVVMLDLKSQFAKDGSWIDPANPNYPNDIMDMLALQVPLSDKGKNFDVDAEPVITSDWARVDVEKIGNNLQLDNKDLTDGVTYTTDFSTVGDAKLSSDDNYHYELAFDMTSVLGDDINVTAGVDGPEFDLEGYGLEVKFSTVTDVEAGVGYVNYIELLDAATGKVKLVEDAAEIHPAIGKDQFLKVEVIDTENDCDDPVTVGFIKLNFVKKAVLKELDVEVDFACGTIEVPVSQEWVDTNVLDAFGLDATTFNTLYQTRTFLYKTAEANGDKFLKPDEFEVVYDAGTNGFTLKIDTDYMLSSGVTEFEGYVRYRYRDAALNLQTLDPLVVHVKVTVNMPNFSVYGHNQTYWMDNTYQALRLNPIVQSSAVNPTANYRGDMLLGFTSATPGSKPQDASQVVKSDGAPAANERFEFDPVALETASYSYAGVTYTWNAADPAERITLSADNMKLLLGGVTAANIAYDAATHSYQVYLSEYGHYHETPAFFRDPLNDAPRNAAKALVGKAAPVRLVADYCPVVPAGVESVVIKSFETQFITPISINAELDGKFEDAIEGGSKVKVDEVMTYTDWRNITLQSGDPLYDYYVIKTPVWDLDNIKTNLRLDGNGNLVPTAGVDDGVMPTDGSNKVYQVTEITDVLGDKYLVYNSINVTVNPTDVPLKLFIPVKVGHKWGEETKIVSIEVHPHPSLVP